MFGANVLVSMSLCRHVLLWHILADMFMDFGQLMRC